jgi:hypothetical protein
MYPQPAGDIENHNVMHGVCRACQFGNVEQAWFVLEVLPHCVDRPCLCAVLQASSYLLWSSALKIMWHIGSASSEEGACLTYVISHVDRRHRAMASSPRNISLLRALSCKK